MPHILGWSVFAAIVLVMLAVDLALVHRKAHAVFLREAAIWSATWVTIALLFGAGVWAFAGRRAGLEYYTGWLIEKALSIDNIFVFAVLFRYFEVPAQFQHRVLFWGVLGALAMRGVMIAAGITLLNLFHWLTYGFGAFLVVTGFRLARQAEVTVRPERNPALRMLRRLLPVTAGYEGQRFFVRRPGLAATPLFVVLVLVETTDLVFAVDSIPAILAITRDPFIVYTSNIFAILGLRSMYFLLASVVDRFQYLRLGLAVVLAVVGVKMLVADLWEVPITLSLAVVAGILVAAVAASLLVKRGAATGPAPASRSP